jgi:hypothetical protein
MLAVWGVDRGDPFVRFSSEEAPYNSTIITKQGKRGFERIMRDAAADGASLR